MHEPARQPEIHLQVFIESAPVRIAMFDQQMRYLTASRRWVEAYGCGRQDLRGICHYELYPNLPDRWIEVHRRGLSGEVLSCKEDHWIQNDGSEQCLDWSVHPWRLDSGEVGGIIISAEDITPRVREQQELNRQSNLLREMGRLSKMAGWEHDLETGKTHWTDQVWEILEIPPQPEIGPDFAAPFLAPASKTNRELAFRGLIERGVQYDLELELTTARGNKKWVRSIAHPIVEEGTTKKVRGTFQDITSRKASEEQFRQLLEAAPDAMVIIDALGQIQLVNHQTERMFGYPRDEILGQGVEVLIPERFRGVCEFYRLALRSGALRLEGATTTLDVEGRRKDGAEFPIGIVLSPFTQASKNLLILNARDLTEKRNAERLVQQNEERLRVAQQAAGLGVFEVAMGDGKRTFSQRAYEIFGLPPDPCLVTFENLLRLVHVDDKPLFERQHKLMLAGKPVHYECRINRPDGRERWIEVYGKSKYSHSRELAFFIGVCGDVTGRKRLEQERTELLASEKKARTEAERARAEVSQVLAGISDAFSVFDKELRYTYANDQSALVAGSTPDQMIGRLLWEVFPKLDRELFETAFDRAIRERGPTEVETFYEPLRKWFHNRIYPTPEGLIVSSHDITDRKRVQTELESSVRKLRTLQARMQAAREEERRAVARELHDQIGQALAAVKINLAWLDQHWPANGNGSRERIGQMVELVGDAAKWIHKICWQLRPEILDDFGLGAAIEWQAKELLRDTGISWEAKVPKYRPMLPDPCAVAIFRIFQEALTNVIRHAEATRCSIRLEEKGDMLILEIEDDGKGICGNGAGSEERSWGILGMKERAEMCGADLRIVRNNGRGTTVRLLVPCRETAIGETNGHADPAGG